MVRMVTFMFCIFYHSKNNLKKKKYRREAVEQRIYRDRYHWGDLLAPIRLAIYKEHPTGQHCICRGLWPWIYDV